MKSENLKLVEQEETKDKFVVLCDSAKININGTWESCVVYQSYQVLGNDGEYVEIPESERDIYVMEKKDFINNFSLCLF